MKFKKTTIILFFTWPFYNNSTPLDLAYDPYDMYAPTSQKSIRQIIQKTHNNEITQNEINKIFGKMLSFTPNFITFMPVIEKQLKQLNYPEQTQEKIYKNLLESYGEVTTEINAKSQKRLSLTGD